MNIYGIKWKCEGHYQASDIERAFKGWLQKPLLRKCVFQVTEIGGSQHKPQNKIMLKRIFFKFRDENVPAGN
jgi:hypothetical protein